MLKRILMITIIVLFIATISYAATPKIYIDDVVKKENDDKVTIDLYLENVESNVASLGLDINYDEKKLEYISSKLGKNLKTTVQIAEYKENNKISVKIESQNGLKTDGVYYQVTFKILDTNVDEIPVKLDVEDVKNSSGNNITYNSSSGIIYTDESKKPNKENTSTTIDPFDKTDIEQSDSLDDIIKPNLNPNIQDKDNIEYEVENPEILEILPNGTMIAKEDGTTKVKVKVNGEEVGDIEVETKDGQVKKVSSNSSENEEKDTEENVIEKSDSANKENKKSVTENGTKISPLIIFLILFGIIAISVIYYKKKYKKSKKGKKNGKIN